MEDPQICKILVRGTEKINASCVAMLNSTMECNLRYKKTQNVVAKTNIPNSKLLSSSDKLQIMINQQLWWLHSSLPIVKILNISKYWNRDN